jgi:hypothetical protein
MRAVKGMAWEGTGERNAIVTNRSVAHVGLRDPVS